MQRLGISWTELDLQPEYRVQEGFMFMEEEVKGRQFNE